jgi:hypothetical protein
MRHYTAQATVPISSTTSFGFLYHASRGMLSAGTDRHSSIRHTQPRKQALAEPIGFSLMFGGNFLKGRAVYITQKDSSMIRQSVRTRCGGAKPSPLPLQPGSRPNAQFVQRYQRRGKCAPNRIARAAAHLQCDFVRSIVEDGPTPEGWSVSERIGALTLQELLKPQRLFPGHFLSPGDPVVDPL